MSPSSTLQQKEIEQNGANGNGVAHTNGNGMHPGDHVHSEADLEPVAIVGMGKPIL